MTTDSLFYSIYYALKFVMFANDPSEMFRFSVEISNILSKLNSQQIQKRFSCNKNLVLLCQKLILLTDETFSSYKYLLNQNIEIFLK
jgi:hypothetical protein